jgi:predicted  nucleic acid-binding Zn-ribbon protein
VSLSAEAGGEKHARSVLTTIVLLQDLDLMIREAQDPKASQEVERLGFRFDGLEKLVAARDEIASTLDRRAMSLYKVAAGRYQGRAVVPVKDRVCLGCSAMQPTGFETDADRLATCQSCGRILYPL